MRIDYKVVHAIHCPCRKAGCPFDAHPDPCWKMGCKIVTVEVEDKDETVV